MNAARGLSHRASRRISSAGPWECQEEVPISAANFTPQPPGNSSLWASSRASLRTRAICTGRVGWSGPSRFGERRDRYRLPNALSISPSSSPRRCWRSGSALAQSSARASNASAAASGFPVATPSRVISRRATGTRATLSRGFGTPRARTSRQSWRASSSLPARSRTTGRNSSRHRKQSGSPSRRRKASRTASGSP